MASLNIVFFTSYAHTQGTYFRWHNLAKALKMLGHSVTVYSADNATDYKEGVEIRDGISYHIVSGNKGQAFVGNVTHPLTALRRALGTYPQADVYHFFQPFPSASLPAYLHRKKAKLLVYDWDDLWYGGWIKGKPKNFNERYFRTLVHLMEAKLPKFIRNMTVCSGYLQDLATERGATNVEVIHNGFWENGQEINRQVAREKFKFKDACFYFGFMGRTTEEIEWCFDVLKETQDRPEEFRLALCGMERSILEGFDPQLMKRVDYFGQLKPEETRYFSKAIDMGLLPLEDSAFNKSRFPIKFAEYLAMNTPALCSDIGEVARLGKSIPGVVLAGEDRSAWKKAIQTQVQHHLQGQTIQVDVEKLKTMLTWDKIAQHLVEYYQKSILKAA